MTAPLLRIGTRGSRLALVQVAELRRRLAEAHPELAPENAVETVVIRTTGDKLTDRPLSGEGGKGLFTKEIEEALIDGRVDLAVHSLKDMTASLPQGLMLGCHLPREDARDAFVSNSAASLDDLPRGASLGTDSIRRKAQLLRARPDLRIGSLRGNVETRLAKLDGGQMDATILAVAGLKRLGLANRITAAIDPTVMLPAPAQGVIAVETRAGDERVAQYLAPVNHADTTACATAERAFFAALDGSCRTPLGAYATIAEGKLTLDAMIIRPDGGTRHATRRQGTLAEAHALGADAGAELKTLGGPAFFA